MDLKQLMGMSGVMVIIVILINGALLAGAIWLVVWVLRALGVL